MDEYLKSIKNFKYDYIVKLFQKNNIRKEDEKKFKILLKENINDIEYLSIYQLFHSSLQLLFKNFNFGLFLMFCQKPSEMAYFDKYTSTYFDPFRKNYLLQQSAYIYNFKKFKINPSIEEMMEQGKLKRYYDDLTLFFFLNNII